MINYIFKIGIIYIVFSLVWAFFLLLYNMLTGFSRNSWQTFIIKCVKTYFLISLVAIFTITYMRVPNQSAPLIATVGLLTLYSYLVGRLEQQRMMIQINNRMGKMGDTAPPNMRLELLLIVVGLVYFTACLYNYNLPYNNANKWFYQTVMDIYDTPVIGWIIGFFGILFLLATLFRAVIGTMIFMQRLQQLLSGKRNNGNDRNDQNNNQDGYSDYEVIE